MKYELKDKFRIEMYRGFFGFVFVLKNYTIGFTLGGICHK